MLCTVPKSPRYSSNSQSRLMRRALAVGILLTMAAALAWSADDEPNPAAIDGKNSPVTLKVTGPDDVLFTWNGGQLTASQVIARLVALGYPATLSWKEFNDLPISQAEQMGQYLVLQDMFFEQANKEQWKRPETIQKDLERETARRLTNALLKAEVVDRVGTPTQEMIQAAYEKNKNSYRIPFSFAMRHLFVGTYRQYKVQKGDTLESIAASQAGDPAAVERLVALTTKKPRKELTDPADKGKMLPLEENEVLMIPFKADEADKVKAKIEEIHGRLNKGEDFKKLAEEFSEAANKGEEFTVTPSKEQPMLQEIIDAVKSTSVGSYSAPFRTKHGWQIILVTKRTEEGYRPIEEVRTVLAQKAQSEEVQRVKSEFIKGLMDKSAFLTIHAEALRPSAKPEQTLATAGNVTYSVQDMLLDAREQATTPTTEAELRVFLTKINRVTEPVLLAEARQRKLDQAPEFQKSLKDTEKRIVAESYLESMIQKKAASPSDGELQKFYDENKEKFYKVPRQLDLYVISCRPNAPAGAKPEEQKKAVQELKDEMNTWKEKITDLKSFRRVAREHSLVKPEAGGYVGKAPTNFDGGIGGSLEKIKVKELTGPVEANGKVYLLWAESEDPGRIQSFDEVKDRAKETYARQAARKARESTLKEWVEKIQFKLAAAVNAEGKK